MRNINLFINDAIDAIADSPVEDGSGSINTDVLLAKCFRGMWNDVNAYLEVERSPGKCGTSYELILFGKKIIDKPGDYDFGLVILTLIASECSSSLTPKSRENLMKLLNRRGNEFLPESWGVLTVVPESENHVISTNISLYITNEILHRDTGESIYNNITNGVHTWMVKILNSLYERGMYEYNSKPYTIFAVKSLLVLFTCAKNEEVKNLTKRVLDRLYFKYALQSSHGKCVVPYRRRPDHLTDIMRRYDEAATWHLANTGEIHDDETYTYDEIGYDTSFIILIRSCTYIPPFNAMELLANENVTVWSICSHTNLELTYREPTFTLFSGGWEDNMFSFKVPFYVTPNDSTVRETCCLLNDGSQLISQLIRFIPVGGFWRMKNSTGVYKNFACGTNLTLPPKFSPILSSNGFSFLETEECYIAMRTTSITFDPLMDLKNVGCFEVVRKNEFQDFASFRNTVITLNSATSVGRFGTSTYNSTRGYEITFTTLPNAQGWLIREVRKNSKIIQNEEISNTFSEYLYAEDENGNQIAEELFILP